MTNLMIPFSLDIFVCLQENVSFSFQGFSVVRGTYPRHAVQFFVAFLLLTLTLYTVSMSNSCLVMQLRLLFPAQTLLYNDLSIGIDAGGYPPSYKRKLALHQTLTWRLRARQMFSHTLHRKEIIPTMWKT